VVLVVPLLVVAAVFHMAWVLALLVVVVVRPGETPVSSRFPGRIFAPPFRRGVAAAAAVSLARMAELEASLVLRSRRPRRGTLRLP